MFISNNYVSRLLRQQCRRAASQCVCMHVCVCVSQSSLHWRRPPLKLIDTCLTGSAAGGHSIYLGRLAAGKSVTFAIRTARPPARWSLLSAMSRNYTPEDIRTSNGTEQRGRDNRYPHRRWSMRFQVRATCRLWEPLGASCVDSGACVTTLWRASLHRRRVHHYRLA